MSYLAIGSVTHAIAQLLTRKLNKPPLLGNVTVRVTTLPPDDDRVSTDTGLNLFLYRVAEHPHLKNMAWRGDRTHTNGSSRPPLALTLNYLVTAYAKRVANAAQDDITAHQLLGNAMAILHENPVLNDVHDADFDADVDTLLPAELRDSFEKVKIGLLPISMEEFSKIWTGLTKAYRLSVAYEVSLVEIAPQAPAAIPAPRAQHAVVTATPMGAPIIASMTPATGPVGTQVTLTGSRFSMLGRTTYVTVGSVTLEEGDLVSLSPTQIVFTMPSALVRGPSVDVTVTSGGFESNPLAFLVQPWISTLTPLRGNSGLPVTIPFAPPAGATISAEVDGQPVAATLSPARTQVTVVIPAALAANGLKPVALIVTEGGTPQRTNALLYDVLPSIRTVTVTTPGAPPRTQIVVQGERLAGDDVQLRIGKLLARVGANADPASLTMQFERLLDDTSGPASVIVDGRESNRLPRTLIRLEPAEAGAGERVTLVGHSLSGRVVVVHFGGEDIAVGAQSFSGRFEVRVPASLAPGAITVSATIDGSDTNAVPFRVIP